jgi:hypothetical protein
MGTILIILAYARHGVKLQEVNMKYYTLSYVVEHKTVFVRRRFKTRDEAINYSFKKLPTSAQLLYEINKGNHNIEYVCNNFNRFWVARCVK